MARPFHIVDVFAAHAYAGNPLAVVLDADGMDTATMQLVAAETNYSETTFVGSRPEADGGYCVRLFTPAREIAFAGHPILGTAWVVRHHVAPQERGPVRLNLPVGQVPVSFEAEAAGPETAWFRAPAVSAGPSCAAERMAAALGLAATDIDCRAPVQQFGASTAAMVVPLNSLDALRRARLDLAAYAPLLAEGFPPLTYLFCRETHQPGNDLCARFFFEAHGVREDPATGNGAAFLGAWLLEYGYLERTELDLRIEQGYEVRRPSLVRVRARGSGAGREISVGGGVIPVVRGELA